MGFPSEKELKKVRAKLEAADPSRTLPKNASKADYVKFKLCEKFVEYIQVNKLTQIQLAEGLAIDPSRIDEIVKYKISLYTIDRLMDLAEKLDLKFAVEVK